MTSRHAILLDLAQLLAIGAGVYFGTKGRMLWVVVLVPLLLVAPFSIYRIVRQRRRERAGDHVQAPPTT